MRHRLLLISSMALFAALAPASGQEIAVDRRVPLLIIHGGDDREVPASEALLSL